MLDQTTREVVKGDAKGWGMIFTYLYVVHVSVLLTYRELRDEEKFRRKYGNDWEKYCKNVPWKTLPSIC